MGRTIFRKIAGRVVPFVNAKLDEAAISAHKKIAKASGLQQKMHKRIYGKEIYTHQQGQQWKQVMERKFPKQIARLDEFQVGPAASFWGDRWRAVGHRGATYVDLKPRISMPQSRRDIRKIGVGLAQKDIATATHELGHTQQFREVSKLTKLRFGRASKLGGPTFEMLHEADAYRRGANLLKGKARRAVQIEGAKRMFISPKYGPVIIKNAMVGTAGATAAAGTIAVVKRKGKK